MSKHMITLKRFVDKNLIDLNMFLLIQLLIQTDKTKIIQQALKTCGKRITVDGLIGNNTLNAIVSTPSKDLINAMNGIINEVHRNPTLKKSVASSPKEFIMSYLGKYEGTHIHYNRGEKSYTTSYGVYKHAFPKSAPIKYVDKLARKYGVNMKSRTDAKRINKKMTEAENAKLRDLVYEFYMKNFMNAKVNNVLDDLNHKKAKLTLFSLSVNGGMGRGNKALQSALGVSVDGKVGNGTLNALKNVKSEAYFNKGMLDYMRGFYLGLIQRNKAKFGRFKNGWMNRLKGLQF